MGVLKNGPADQAGIQKGDIILSINDQAFENSNQLISYVGRQKPNSEVPAVILRADKKLNITIKIAERPESKTGQFLPVPQQQPR